MVAWLVFAEEGAWVARTVAAVAVVHGDVCAMLRLHPLLVKTTSPHLAKQSLQRMLRVLRRFDPVHVAQTVNRSVHSPNYINPTARRWATSDHNHARQDMDRPVRPTYLYVYSTTRIPAFK